MIKKVGQKSERINVRVSIATRRKMERLAGIYSSQSEVLIVAIDRLFVAEFGDKAGIMEKDEIEVN